MSHSSNPLKSTLGEEFFKDLPNAPGVYFMLGSGERLLYIGKAKRLRTRLRSYARLMPGKDEERLVEMISHVRSIRWELQATEAKALAREAALLHALRPPYNVAGTEDELYLYIGVRRERTALELKLSNWPDFEDEGYEIYGAYRQRGKIKRGFGALLRLLYAYQCKPRFSHYPARISREKPPWVHRTEFPAELEAELHAFLSGSSRRLLSLIFEGLLAHEGIPRFMRPSIQQDIDDVKELFRLGPGRTCKLRRRGGLRAQWVEPERMRELVAAETAPLQWQCKKNDSVGK
jgi:excinuclease UvrABC nuclease subunit